MKKQSVRYQGRDAQAEPARVTAPARLFAADLDMTAFREFDSYRRWFVGARQRRRGPEKQSRHEERVRRRPTLRDVEKLISRLFAGRPEILREHPAISTRANIRRLAKQRIAEANLEAKRASKHRRKTVATLLRKFEECRFVGPSDFVHRLSFKDALRGILVQYVTGEFGRVHVSRLGVMVPTGYQLSGQAIGGFEFLRPTEGVRRLVVEALVWHARRTLGLLWTLAEEGQSLALLRLGQAIVPLVKAVNERVARNAANFGSWPRGLPFWPVLKSLHHGYDCDHLSFLRLLHVGEDFPFKIVEEARWTARDPVGRWAIHLCQEVETMQDGHPVGPDSEPWEHKLEKLNHFSPDTWKDWWEVGKGLLLHDYIDVVEIPELNETVTAKDDRRSPGRIRKRIFQALKDKFKSMASSNKVRWSERDRVGCNRSRSAKASGAT